MENSKQPDIPWISPSSDLLKNGKSVTSYTLEQHDNGEVAPVNVIKEKKDEKTEDSEEKKGTSLSQLPKKSIIMLCIFCSGNFLGGCVFALLAPFYPALAKKKGVDQTMIGLIFSVFEMVYFCIAPILGKYLVQIGTKFVYHSGLLLLGGSTFIFGILDKSPPGGTFIGLSIACRAVGSVGMASMYTSQMAIASKLFPGDVATMFGIINSFQAVGLMAGPAVGGTLYTAGGFGLPFFVVGLIVLILSFATIPLIPEVNELPPETDKSALSLFKSVYFVLGFLGNVVFSLGISFMDPTISAHLHKLNMSTLAIGFVMAIAPAFEAITSPAWGYLCDKKNLKNIISLCTNAFIVLALLAIGPSPLLPFLPFTITTVVLGLLLYGICAGGIVLSSMKMLLVGASEQGFDESASTSGLVVGMLGSGFCTGAMLGPLLGSWLVQMYGFPWAATIFAGPHLVYFIACCIYFGYLRIKASRKTTLLSPS